MRACALGIITQYTVVFSTPIFPSSPPYRGIGPENICIYFFLKLLMFSKHIRAFIPLSGKLP